jgi:hypothetical protein
VEKSTGNNYPRQGFLPLFAFLERQLSFPLRLRFPINSPSFFFKQINPASVPDAAILLISAPGKQPFLISGCEG